MNMLPTTSPPPRVQGSSRYSGVAFRRHVAIYAASTVLVHSVGLATAPIFTRHFGPARYGTLEVMSATVALMVTLVSAGLDVAVGRSYARSSDVEDRQTAVSTGLFAVVGLGSAVALCAAAFARPLAGLLLGDRLFSRVVTFAALGVPLTVTAGYLRRVLRLEDRPWLSLVSATMLAGIGALCAVALGVTLSMGLSGVYAGIAIGAACAVVLNLVVNRHILRPRFSRRHLVAMVAVGLPLLPASLSTWALRMVDRFILVRWVDLDEIGLYGIANRVSNVVLLAVFAFEAAWVPFVLNLDGEDRERAARARARVLPLLTGGVAFLAVTVAAFGPQLLRVLADERFDAAAPVVPVLLLALLFYSMTPVAVSAAVIAGRTRRLALHAGSAVAVNILACLLLVPPFGIAGAAWATVLAFAYQAFTYHRLGQQVAPVAYDVRRIILLLALSVPYLALGYLDLGATWVTVSAKSLAVLSFPVLLISTGIVQAGDLRHLGFRRVTR
jgi:O-antigen/teichoic acid export membrane protein